MVHLKTFGRNTSRQRAELPSNSSHRCGLVVEGANQTTTSSAIHQCGVPTCRPPPLPPPLKHRSCTPPTRRSAHSYLQLSAASLEAVLLAFKLSRRLLLFAKQRPHAVFSQSVNVAVVASLAAPATTAGVVINTTLTLHHQAARASEQVGLFLGEAGDGHEQLGLVGLQALDGLKVRLEARFLALQAGGVLANPFAKHSLLSVALLR